MTRKTRPQNVMARFTVRQADNVRTGIFQDELIPYIITKVTGLVFKLFSVPTELPAKPSFCMS